MQKVLILTRKTRRSIPVFLVKPLYGHLRSDLMIASYVKEVIFKNLTGCKERQSLAFIIVRP